MKQKPIDRFVHIKNIIPKAIRELKRRERENASRPNNT